MRRHTKKPDETHVGNGTSRKLAWFSLGLGAAELVAPRVLSRALGVESKGHTAAAIRAMGARELGNGVALLSRPHAAGPRWMRVVGDLIDLGFLAYAAGAKRKSGVRIGIAIAAVVGIVLIDVLASRKTHE